MSKPVTALLLHSFGSAGRSWSAVRARLDAPSVAPDLPGFGDAAPLPEPCVSAYADWVCARMAEIEGDVVLVAASMGGKIAMAVSARRPPGLRALVLCAPSPPTPEPMEAGERERRLASWGDASAAAESVAQSTRAPPLSADFAAAVEDWLRTAPSAWRWWWGEGSREVIDVAAATTPAEVLVGDEDDHLGAELQRRETLPRLSGSHLRGVAGSRHLLALDRPDAVAEAVEASMARRRPR